MFTGEQMREVFLEKLAKDKSFDAAIWKVAWVAYCQGIKDAAVPTPMPQQHNKELINGTTKTLHVLHETTSDNDEKEQHW